MTHAQSLLAVCLVATTLLMVLPPASLAQTYPTIDPNIPTYVPQTSVSGTLTIALSKPASVDLPVSYVLGFYSPGPGTVNAGAADMETASGTVTVPPGAKLAQVPVRVFADSLIEGNERFRLQCDGGYQGAFTTEPTGPRSTSTAR